MARLLGEKLRHLRLQRNLTQADLARQLSRVTRAHIGNVETQSRPPSLLFVLRVARLFGVTTDYLLLDSIPVANAAVNTARHSRDQAGLPEHFGAKLYNLRKQRRLTQSTLARQLGLATHAHISYLEHGRHEPSIDLVIAIADLFAVTTDYLIWDSIPVQIVSSQDS